MTSRRTLIVCPLSRLAEIADARRPSHVLTVLSPDTEPTTFGGFAPRHHLRLECHDVIEQMPGLTAPDEMLMKNMLSFGAGWDGTEPMLIHCWAGISRSTAAAFILACQRNPNASEQGIAATLRRHAPFATPNRLMVALADALLSRDGRMVDAVAYIGKGADAFEGVPFDFPA